VAGGWLLVAGGWFCVPGFLFESSFAYCILPTGYWLFVDGIFNF
jgi:hypothetical protein